MIPWGLTRANLRYNYCNLWNKLGGGAFFVQKALDLWVLCMNFGWCEKKKKINVVTNDHRVVIFWETPVILFKVCQGVCTFKSGSLERCIFALKCLRRCEKKSTCAPNNYAPVLQPYTQYLCGQLNTVAPEWVFDAGIICDKDRA
jgi:hypothetical protein